MNDQILTMADLNREVRLVQKQLRKELGRAVSFPGPRATMDKPQNPYILRINAVTLESGQIVPTVSLQVAHYITRSNGNRDLQYWNVAL